MDHAFDCTKLCIIIDNFLITAPYVNVQEKKKTNIGL